MPRHCCAADDTRCAQMPPRCAALMPAAIAAYMLLIDAFAILSPSDAMMFADIAAARFLRHFCCCCAAPFARAMPRLFMLMVATTSCAPRHARLFMLTICLLLLMECAQRLRHAYAAATLSFARLIFAIIAAATRHVYCRRCRCRRRYIFADSASFDCFNALDAMFHAAAARHMLTLPFIIMLPMPLPREMSLLIQLTIDDILCRAMR